MNIGIALNQKYLRYTYVMLTSLFCHHEKKTIHLYVLHNDLTNEGQAALRYLATEYENHISFLLVDKNIFPSELPKNDSWTLETYFRLMLTDLIPKSVDRLLYLDVDTIINQNLSTFYNSDFENMLFIACKDMASNGLFTDIRAAYFNQHIKAGYQYFNAGVMLWNMESIRRKYHFKDYMELCQKLKFQVFAPDQDLLNYMHMGQLLYADEYTYNLFARLAYNYNIHYEQVKKECAILHYTGHKPWCGKTVHYDIEKIWWDYAKMTPFYNELLEEFVLTAITDPSIYNTMRELSNDKTKLLTELKKCNELCKQLYPLTGLTT